jgi:predicted PurR-regulated permease PerM
MTDPQSGKPPERRLPGPPGPPAEGERRRRVVGWRSRDILRTAALLAGIWIFLQLLWFAHSIFFVIFLGVLFGLGLSAGVDQLERIRVPRVAGTILIVLALFSTLALIGAMIAPQLSQQARELERRLPQAIDQAEEFVQQHLGSFIPAVLPEPPENGDRPPGAQGEEEEEPRLRDRVTDQLRGATGYLFAFLQSTIAVVAGLLLSLFVAIYIAVDPKTYKSGLMHLFPHRFRPRAEEVLGKTALLLRRWLVTQLVAMVAVGVVTTLILMLLDVPAALALGVIAGLLEFIPMFGPLLASIPAIGMAFLDSPQKALMVAGAYLVIQQLESQVLTPLLMKEGIDLPPVLTLVSGAIMALVFGFIGLLVAVPLVGAAMVPIKMLYVEGVVGDEVSLPGDKKDGDDEDEEEDED